MDDKVIMSIHTARNVAQLAKYIKQYSKGTAVKLAAEQLEKTIINEIKLKESKK